MTKKGPIAGKILVVVLLYLMIELILGNLPNTLNSCDVLAEPTDLQLAVPWIPQKPPGTWEKTKNCGQASSLMIFDYYRKTRDPNDTSDDPCRIWQINYWLNYRYPNKGYMDPSGNGAGTWYELPLLAKEFGGFKESSRHTNFTLDNLKNELSQGYPVIVGVYTDMSETGGTSHWMVLTGIDDTYVYVNDPGHSLASGKHKCKYTINQFKQCWARENNTAVTIHPPGISKTSSEFQEPGNTEGWMAYNVEYRYEDNKPYLGFSVNRDDPDRNGVFYIDPAASDPYIVSPLLSIDANNYNTVEICMASNAPDTTGAIYFVTSDSPEWKEDKKVEFTVTNDGKYRTYPVSMAGNRKWAGTITGIRIDPANDGISGANIDTVGFDYIRLTKTSPPSGRVSPDLDTKYWEDGLYQLRITAQASPGDVSSITISGPHIDTATVQTGGGDPHHLYDDGKHHDGAANDGEWWVLLNIKEAPAIGETITFYIKYNDGSSEIVSKTIDGLVTETATLVSPPDGSTVDTLTPTFQWRNPSISGLIYSVQIDDPRHNRVYSVYDLPDGTTSHTVQKPLTRGATYLWLVSASDSNGNEALTCWDKLRISSLTGLGYDEVTQVTDTINQGTEAVFNYIISQIKDLIFALGWEGSTLKLSVYKPDGSLYCEEENSTSPITISVPKAEAGEWRYEITGIDVPYEDYPFVAEIGERPPVTSDLENLVVYPNPCRLTDGNPTITFKGLTADATIRILGIDGQLINEAELIGQVNWTWNVKNQANEDLSRGIYIYLITNSAGEKKIGKIAIIK